MSLMLQRYDENNQVGLGSLGGTHMGGSWNAILSATGSGCDICAFCLAQCVLLAALEGRVVQRSCV